MNDTTARLALPYILPGQAQKEFFHNESLVRVDIALHAAVEETPLATPPSSPSAGQSWIVAPGAAGDWSGQDGKLASWTENGWRYISPIHGMAVWNKTSGTWIYWSGNEWSSGELPASAIIVDGKKVVGARQPAIPSPSGGTIIDVEARSAIAALTAALKSHGIID